MVTFRSGVGYRGGCTSRLAPSDRARVWVPRSLRPLSADLCAAEAQGETHPAAGFPDGLVYLSVAHQDIPAPSPSRSCSSPYLAYSTTGILVRPSGCDLKQDRASGFWEPVPPFNNYIKTRLAIGCSGLSIACQDFRQGSSAELEEILQHLLRVAEGVNRRRVVEGDPLLYQFDQQAKRRRLELVSSHRLEPLHLGEGQLVDREW